MLGKLQQYCCNIGTGVEIPVTISTTATGLGADVHTVQMDCGCRAQVTTVEGGWPDGDIRPWLWDKCGGEDCRYELELEGSFHIRAIFWMVEV